MAGLERCIRIWPLWDARTQRDGLLTLRSVASAVAAGQRRAK